jgi:hypothetical protein
MKIRIGFVSNSSSSSFVIIDSNGKSPFQIEKYNSNILEVNGDFCHMDFGWESNSSSK